MAPVTPVAQGFHLRGTLRWTAVALAKAVSPAKPRRFTALKRYATLVLLMALAVGAAACEMLTGDSATRVVDAVRAGASRLKSSSSDTLVLSVAWRSWPGGCPGGYRVEWRADSDRIPGLGVICTTGRGGYATISYRDFVKVPRPLQVTKGKGEPVTIALRKSGNGGIDVVALQ